MANSQENLPAELEFIARKIQVERWDRTPYTKNDEDVRVDSLTGRCLMTGEEKLSVWKCKNAKEDVSQVVLALGTSFTVNKGDGVSIVLLLKDDLVKEGFSFEETDGDTKVADLKKRHYDIKALDIDKLLRIATEITHNVRQDKNLFEFTIAEVQELFEHAIEAKRVDRKDVPKGNLRSPK